MAASVRGTPSVRATPRDPRLSRQSLVPDSPGSRSTITTASRRSGNDLSDYEPPQFSLTPQAQRALAALAAQNPALNKLNKSLDEAQATLTLCAGEINDRLTKQRTDQERRKRKRTASASQGDDVEEEDEGTDQHLDELQDKVDRMTQRMDETLRKMIDGKEATQHIKDSVGAVAEDAQRNASTQASTLRTRSQHRPRNTDGSDDDSDEEDEVPDFTPTDPMGGTQPPIVPLEDFKKKLADAKTRYQSRSLAGRYAENTEYKTFKGIVHDARHPEDGQEAPHPRTWFAEEGGVPAPGVTTGGAGNEDDSDDDIAISRAQISTKCPLTLQEFKDPLTSKKCNHSFEASAIRELLRTARGNVQCPVGACRESLSTKDLHTDQVLLRKIKRIQRAKELEEEDAEDDGDRDGRTQRNATLIDDEDGADVDAVVERQTQTQTQKMKKEPRGSVAPPRSSTAPQSTAPIDLGESSEEEEDE